MGEDKKRSQIADLGLISGYLDEFKVNKIRVVFPRVVEWVFG